MPAEVSGVLKIKAQEDETVEVGAVICEIDEDAKGGESKSEEKSEDKKKEGKSEPKQEKKKALLQVMGRKRLAKFMKW